MRILIISFLTIIAFNASAQVRVIDKSGRQPSWVNSLEKNYIIAVGTAQTITQAQENALTMVKERIVNSIAENVKTSTEFKRDETTMNSNISSFLEQYSSTTTTSSAPVPFLQGISLSKVEEFYWEQTKDRNTGAEVFNYHIKYPFSEAEQKKLVMDFQIRDREMNEELEKILSSFEEIKTVEEIDGKIAELKILSDYFMDGRKDRARMGITNLSNLYKNIEIMQIESKLGEIKFALRLNGKPIATSKKATIKSDCARITGTENMSDFVLVKYDYDNCYEDPENNIQVTYRLGNHNIRNSFYFDVSANKTEIFINQPIRFSALTKNDITITKSEINIEIISKYSSPFIIEKVVLEIPDNNPIVIESINQKYSGKGNHSLRLNYDKDIISEKTSSSGKRNASLSGFIYFKSETTGVSSNYRIFNLKYTTDW